ncbi:hypothetical protein [Planctomycetes bacterium Poly30]|uniref:hypothetical protein n=1 Tax=Saltatorellus ferox TaxID=2528018 RepID=UPI0011A28B43
MLIASDEPPLDDSVAWDPGDTARRTRLAPGNYSAAIRTEMGYGAVTGFAVDDRDVTVPLEPPRLFDLRLGVTDTVKFTDVPDAEAICTRVDLANGWPAGNTFRALTDSDGQVMFEGLARGEWEIRIEKAGYQTGSFETPLPGPWEPHIDAYGFIDMQEYGIAPIRTLTLQLIGADDHEDLSLYSGNHSSLVPPLPFDSDGRLDLQLGYFVTPLFLYVVYPDGQQTAMNLLGDLPPEGEALEVSVGGERTLEVDLRVSQTVRASIGDSDCFIRVFFKTSSGDTRRIRQKALEDGLFEFHGVQGEHATVCFHVEAESGRSDWTIQEVQLRDMDAARTTLNVDSHPPRILFTDEKNEPLAGLWTELFVLPHDSTWHRGNYTDENGLTTGPRIEKGQIAYSASLDENSVFAVDALMPELMAGVNTQVKLRAIEPTFVEVTVDGQPAPQAYVQILGARSGRSVDVSYTDAQGRSRTNGLTSDSSAAFRVIVPGAWWGRETEVLRPGLNKAELRSMGVLQASSEQTLRSAFHVDTGSSIGQWIDADLAHVRPSASNGVELSVPVGTYRLDEGLETQRNYVVVAGRTVELGG